MKTYLFRFGIGLMVVFLTAQVFQPEKNDGVISPSHLYQSAKVPGRVQHILSSSCLDCHSDNTKYVWYHHISPVSWFISGHIREGKGELNFSTWNSLSVIDKLGALEDIREEVEKGKMPLKSYLFMHPEAKLSQADRDSLFAWIDACQLEIVTTSRP